MILSAQSDLFIKRYFAIDVNYNAIHNHPDAFYFRDGLIFAHFSMSKKFAISGTVGKMIIDDRQRTEKRENIRSKKLYSPTISIIRLD